MVQVASFYRFVEVVNPKELKRFLLDVHELVPVSGYILVATEGINGAIAGSESQLNDWFSALSADRRFENLRYRLSYANTHPFPEYKVRVRGGLVSLGVTAHNVLEDRGEVVSSRNWNALIQRSDIVLIDMRKELEFELGHFKGSVNMAAKSFNQFPDWAGNNLSPEQPIAMFCTGGIRCEKASAYLRQHGFSEVYQLEGGILQYLAEVPKGEHLWEGNCFVFDERGAVDSDLQPVAIELCHACSYAIQESDQSHPHYLKDAYCPRCFEQWTDEQRQRFVAHAEMVSRTEKAAI